MDKTLSDKLEYGTEPFARTLSGSVFAFQLADRLRSGTCLASALLSLMLCKSQCKDIVRLIPSQLQSWGTKAEGLFCHSNFVYTRFHGTEPFYHKIIFHTNF